MRDQPAGWYRDRERPNVHRYWTGERWSDRTGEELAVSERGRVPAQRRDDPDLAESGGPQVYEQRRCG
jgi:hypothetical protein